VRDVETVPGENRGQRGGHMVVVLDEEKSHPGPLDPSDVLSEYAVNRYECANAHVRAHRAVMLMDRDGVKRVPVAPRFRYPADMRTGDKCYDTCPIAIGS
jgi:hypothetical protein